MHPHLWLTGLLAMSAGVMGKMKYLVRCAIDTAISHDPN
jgi:hypothetical protein